MGVRDMLRRRRTIGMDRPIGMGESDGDLDPGEGGPSLFMQELAEYRWTAQQEAVNLARRGVDPERWDKGRMAFEYERALAHGHEVLRDRLASYVAQRVRDEARELYGLAGGVALVRDELRTIDEKLVRVAWDWKCKHDEVAGDELELSRYYRLRSLTSRTAKYAIAAMFVISEFIISGLVFERIFSDLPPGLGYVLALGVTLALIIIPHFTALGLKAGLTQNHIFKKWDLEKQGKAVPPAIEFSVHVEERDDRGFRRTAFLLGGGLLILIVPLSWIRAHNDGDFSWPAFLFLMLLQYALSGYFFLREWLDHGDPSHSLYKLVEEKEQVEAARRNLLADLDEALTDYYDHAEDLIFTIQQAPRWDSHIVESFNETVRYYRHLIALEQPEPEQFISWARMPYLGSKQSAAESPYPLDPVSDEHRSLDDDSPFGRDWWMRQATDALRGPVPGDGGGTPAGWLVSKSPDVLLAEILRRHYDLDINYQRPAGIDRPDPDPGRPQRPKPDVDVTDSAEPGAAVPTPRSHPVR